MTKQSRYRYGGSSRPYRSVYRYGGSSRPYRSLYRHGGSGIFTDIIRRTLSKDNVKKLIKGVSKSNLAQKTFATVLKGSKAVLKPEKVIKGLTSLAVSNYLDNKRKKKEHKQIVNSVVRQLSDKNVPSRTLAGKVVNRGKDKRSYADRVINSSGKGIVYD